MINDEAKTVQNTLHVRIQQYSGRKYLTIIEGVVSDAERTSLYKFLRKELACGGANKKEKGVVQLMGDHSFVIKELLELKFPGHNVVVHGRKA